ncbi:MAG: 2,3-bisphosphoglycerate-dependent phosphoglycerate mutase [Rhizobiales bacterium]|nr:2,3-bisphosphoglycerate-dependent phosphoglycerate mutase [Hyphomicrobiales bacterium]
MNNVMVLVRHGQSEWNLKNLFTGWKDVDLTELGIEEANKAGALIKAENIKFDIAFTSKLMRAQKTLKIMLKVMGQEDLETIEDERLNERDYGDLTGLNKDDARKKWGDEQVHIWRRSFDTPPPGGESLKGTADRVLPYFNSDILPRYLKGENVIVAAHGNSLRALIMQIENISKDDITSLNLGTGVPMIYILNEEGTVESVRKLEL